MSRTDKDRPYRVRAYFDGEVAHRHEFGECRVESERAALNPTPPRFHYRNCKKYETVVVDCPGADLSDILTKYYYYTSDCCRIAADQLRVKQDNARYNGKTGQFNDRWGYGRRHLCNYEHAVKVFRSDWHCACDEWEKTATCTSSLPGNRWRWMESAPHDFRQIYHRERRQTDRASLDHARRDYNTHGETEIEPVEMRHRHCANWYYW